MVEKNTFDEPQSPAYWRKWYLIILVAHVLVIVGLYLFTLAFHR
jgi:hypothetical protein